LKPFYLEAFSFPESFVELQNENIMAGDHRQFQWVVVKEKQVKIIIDGDQHKNGSIGDFEFLKDYAPCTICRHDL
jgi:hypothetical protein